MGTPTSSGAPGVTDAMRAECHAEVQACMSAAAAEYHAGRINLFEMDQRMAMCLAGYAGCLARKVAAAAVAAVQALMVTIDGGIYNLTGHHVGDVIVVGITIVVIICLIPLIVAPIIALA